MLVAWCSCCSFRSGLCCERHMDPTARQVPTVSSNAQQAEGPHAPLIMCVTLKSRIGCRSMVLSSAVILAWIRMPGNHLLRLRCTSTVSGWKRKEREGDRSNPAPNNQPHLSLAGPQQHSQQFHIRAGSTGQYGDIPDFAGKRGDLGRPSRCYAVDPHRSHSRRGAGSHFDAKATWADVLADPNGLRVVGRPA